MSVQKAEKSKVIFWAADPFEREALPTAAVKGLEAWAASLGADIQPVYVASPSVADISLGYVAPVRDLEKKLNQFTAQAGLQHALPAKIIFEEASSRAGAISKMLELAERANAVAIAVSSHGRAGLGRLMVGSFAENILRDATLPIFFLGHKASGPGYGPNLKTVLFATDFSQNSHRAFRKFLLSANHAGAKVVLFHSVGFPMPYGAEATMYIPENFVEDRKSWATNEAKAWIKEAKKFGFDASLMLRDGGAGFVTGNNILKVALDLDVSMIVLASSSGALDRTLFGSAAFEVFRSGARPALVYGPRALSEVHEHQSPKWEKQNWARSGS